MGKGGDTSAPPDALLAEALLADAAPAAAPCSGDGSALSRPPSRLSNWRDALASAPKRKVGEELPGVASVASVASLGTPSGGGPAPARAVRARAAPLPAALRADAALRDACRLDQGAQASDDEICAPDLWGEAAASGAAAAAAAAAGYLPALPLLHAATADGQPLDDALWGVAPQPRAAPEPEVRPRLRCALAAVRRASCSAHPRPQRPGPHARAPAPQELAMLLGPDDAGAEDEGACLGACSNAPMACWPSAICHLRRASGAYRPARLAPRTPCVLCRRSQPRLRFVRRVLTASHALASQTAAATAALRLTCRTAR